MAKIKIDSNLFERVKKATEAAGYSSAEEFITHIIEKELTKYEADQTDEKVADQLRGLGYIE
ncbi:MAG: ribbon-helix-helix domain-containing protein [Planctomycetota bacterium]|jgi:metal-responsive CopG/Arc/MetJ family transcriptional regulator